MFGAAQSNKTKNIVIKSRTCLYFSSFSSVHVYLIHFSLSLSLPGVCCWCVYFYATSSQFLFQKLNRFEFRRIFFHRHSIGLIWVVKNHMEMLLPVSIATEPLVPDDFVCFLSWNDNNNYSAFRCALSKIGRASLGRRMGKLHAP